MAAMVSGITSSNPNVASAAGSPGLRRCPQLLDVDIAKLRWRIERDYQELKQEIGLGHYEGRGWRGFHHHGTCASRPTDS